MEAPPPADGRPAPSGRPGWTVVAALALGAVGLHVVVAVVAVVTWEPALLAGTLAWALFWWWVHRGAWLRSPRGRPAPGTPPPWAEPELTDRRARWYVGAALGCVAAASVAVVLQAFVLSR